MRKPLVLIGIDLSHAQDPDPHHFPKKGTGIPPRLLCPNPNIGHDHVTSRTLQTEVERGIHIPHLHLVQVVEDQGHALSQIISQRHIHGEKGHILSHQRGHIASQGLGRSQSQRGDQTDTHLQNPSRTRRRNTTQGQIHDQDPLKSGDPDWMPFFNRIANPLYFKGGDSICTATVYIQCTWLFLVMF